MLTIDRLTESDLPNALRLSTQAGWNQIDADWRRLLSLWPDTCLAGRFGGSLVATATLAVFDAPAGGRLGWVGMVLVDEAHRGRGLGTAMLDAVLLAGREGGITTFALDATDLGRPVYAKRGFRDVIGIDRWVGKPAANRGDRSPPAAATDWQSLAKLDLDATGVNRFPLLRHLGNEPGGRVQFHRDGFACRRTGRVADHVGPVVARSDAVARELIEGLNSTGEPNRPSFIDVPRSTLDDWFNATGWSIARRLTRMACGLSVDDISLLLAGPHVYAAAGFELG